LKRGMLLSSIIAGTKINHTCTGVRCQCGKGGFGNHSSASAVTFQRPIRVSSPSTPRNVELVSPTSTPKGHTLYRVLTCTAPHGLSAQS
jgi:hypothetical protein